MGLIDLEAAGLPFTWYNKRLENGTRSAYIRQYQITEG